MYRRRPHLWGLLAAVVWLVLLLVVLVTEVWANQVPPRVESDICGVISADATWTRAASPYLVTCDTTLDSGVRLDVEPGVEVRFAPGVDLVVKGTLAAYGSLTLPITLTSNQATPAPGDWIGLRFEAGSSASVLAWCTIEYGTIGARVYAVSDNTVSPILADCTFRHNTQYGILVEGRAYGCQGATASPSISRCTIEHNGEGGIYYYGHGSNVGCTVARYGVAGGILANSVIQNNGLGVHIKSEMGYLSKGRVNPSLDGNRILNNLGSGILMEGDDPVQARIQNNLIYENTQAGIYWGVEDASSDLHIVNNTIVANGQDGIMCTGSYADNTTIANNIVSRNGRYGLSCSQLPYPEIWYNDVWLNTLGAYDGCVAGASNLAADPLLVDTMAGDFRLQFGSPCIDAGTGSDAPGSDIVGVSRPQGNGFDIGVYEFWAPEIRLKQGATEIGMGESYDFGRVHVGSSRALSFAIENLGNRVLHVDAVDVWPADQFTATVSGGLPLAVAPGLSSTFDLAFAPQTPGEHTSSVSIVNDDPDETPYTFTLSGMGQQSILGLSVSGPATGLIQQPCVFTAAVRPVTATQPITYTWRATGQLPVTSTAGLSDSLSFSWDTRGQQLITVTAANIQDVLVVTHPITIYTPAESDFVAAPTFGPAPLTVAFTNTSSGDYAAVWWDLGDGTTSTLASPTHIFATAGTYTVALTVSGPGGTDGLTRSRYISVYAPVRAMFSGAPTFGPSPLAVVFANTSSGDYASSLWDLGDGVTSTLESPAHTYAAVGAYTVRLEVSGPGGRDAAAREAYIVVEPYRVYLPLVLRTD
jgi:PKD repeat protein